MDTIVPDGAFWVNCGHTRNALTCRVITRTTDRGRCEALSASSQIFHFQLLRRECQKIEYRTFLCVCPRLFVLSKTDDIDSIASQYHRLALHIGVRKYASNPVNLFWKFIKWRHWHQRPKGWVPQCMQTCMKHPALVDIRLYQFTRSSE